jgi:transcriptional regulator with XRE-family HTH domain
VHPLQRLIINRLADLGLTYREAADRSSGLISFGRLNQIANGNLGNLTEKTIRGIALACDVPPAAVRELAVSDVEPVQFRLPERTAYLSPRSRKLLMDMTNTLLEAEGLKGKHKPRKDNGDGIGAAS